MVAFYGLAATLSNFVRIRVLEGVIKLRTINARKHSPARCPRSILLRRKSESEVESSVGNEVQPSDDENRAGWYCAGTISRK
jgi:hypothetical protein